MATSKLQKWFPWALSPIICNGPMLNAACPHLATEVSKAGGIGFTASSVNMSEDSDHIKKLDTDLAEAQSRIGDLGFPLRMGVSFITGHESIKKFSQHALPIIAKYKPAVVWLFAPEESVKPHGDIIKAVKGLDSPPRVFVQVGNVSTAREAVQDGADAIVAQGIDAGGHQFRRGMGIISFVPEVKHMLAQEFAEKDIPVLAAGGIVNGKGVAAALALGADGIVMGTRFTVADESIYPAFRKELVLSAKDGGTATLKSPFNDQINKNALWGPLYDGRAIISTIHQQFIDGASLEECQAELQKHAPEEATRLISTWAGTGVGLVNQAGRAGDIVKEVRNEAKEVIRQLSGSI